jgi:hypothetical protein
MKAEGAAMRTVHDVPLPRMRNPLPGSRQRIAPIIERLYASNLSDCGLLALKRHRLCREEKSVLTV